MNLKLRLKYALNVKFFRIILNKISCRFQSECIKVFIFHIVSILRQYEFLVSLQRLTQSFYYWKLWSSSITFFLWKSWFWSALKKIRLFAGYFIEIFLKVVTFLPKHQHYKAELLLVFPFNNEAFSGNIMDKHMSLKMV